MNNCFYSINMRAYGCGPLAKYYLFILINIIASVLVNKKDLLMLLKVGREYELPDYPAMPAGYIAI